MTKRGNAYEAAFEEFLREREDPYVAVDETKRSLFGGASIKNLDFIVSSPGGRYLVDIKGRCFPSGKQARYWVNWSTRDDLESLHRWEQLFGGQFTALLVFAYQVVGDRAPVPAHLLYAHRGATYGFVGVRLRDYAQRAKVLSPKWDTLNMPAAQFRMHAQPIQRFLQPPSPDGALEVVSPLLIGAPPSPTF